MEERPKIPPKGKLLGIDFGTVRIGIAICDPDRIIASPYEILVRKSEAKDLKYLANLAQQERIVGFVLGLPLHLNGDLSEKAQEAIHFGDLLAKETSLPVEYMDERFTSVEAEHFLLEAGLTRKKRKERIDKVAAQILLSVYLERGGIGTTVFESLD
ncbi:MAG: Holliday junction resolvase RuvX [Planctomycetia bacterium]|nr:Holliday junction resolvase RuvX [Planctomycetia bacterium]